MEAAIERIDAEYEVVFSEPLFDLPRRNVEVLESFYQRIEILSTSRHPLICRWLAAVPLSEHKSTNSYVWYGLADIRDNDR